MNITKDQGIQKNVFFNLKENKTNNKEDMGMKFKFMGIGAAGNKAAMDLINAKVAEEKDVILVNSTRKDIPKEFGGKTIILSTDGNGCGKERAIAKEYALQAMKAGVFDNLFSNDEDSVLIVTSVEGGTGSGSAPIIGNYCCSVLGKNVHMVAFTGFEEDARGLQNTVEFFQEINFDCDIQTIRNSSFNAIAKGNKFKAEELANDEFVSRVRILTGRDLVDSSQNIDDTDIFKVVSTNGYKTIESIQFDDILTDMEQFNKLCRQMIYSSKSLKSNNPGQLRMGVILNIKPESEGAIDYNFEVIKEAYGVPFESFFHKQYDGKKQYIQLISSGMKMPLEEVKAIHERYLAATAAVDKKNDNFFDEISKLTKNSEDSKFDMVRSGHRPGSKESFLHQFETKPSNN